MWFRKKDIWEIQREYLKDVIFDIWVKNVGNGNPVVDVTMYQKSEPQVHSSITHNKDHIKIHYYDANNHTMDCMDKSTSPYSLICGKGALEEHGIFNS